MTNADEHISATLVVPAPTAELFRLLADPSTHGAIDGTGWVRGSVSREPLTEVGQLFRMDMHHEDHPDGDYRTVNQVTTMDPPRCIAWTTGTEHEDGTLELGGWIWRYDLLPIGDSSTEVTLSYDWSAVPDYIREYLDFPVFGPDHLPRSLQHLAELSARR